ncbi:TPA: hypothetical protein ACFK14_05385 [Neisseria gonorrhoeae]
MPSERFSDGIFCVFREGAGSYSGLTKIGTRRRAAGSTNGTEPVRPVLGRLRESFPLSRGGATPYRFKVNPP